MSSCPSRCDAAADVLRRALELGAVAAGCVPAGPVDPACTGIYADWVESGRSGEMAFAARYRDVRDDPRLLLEGARTLFSLAVPYPAPCDPPSDTVPGSRIAAYAHAADYHLTVRKILTDLGDYLRGRHGGETRVCVDSAPIRERYWAERCGLGTTGINNQLIVPGRGSYVHLGELLWTGDTWGPLALHAPARHESAAVGPGDSAMQNPCLQCAAPCVRACPNGALDGIGGCDVSRCVSYLTIERRGELPGDLSLGGYIYGCDICQRVCPCNRPQAATPSPSDVPPGDADANPLAGMILDEISALTSSHYRRLVAGTAMSRVPLAQLLRNISRL